MPIERKIEDPNVERTWLGLIDQGWTRSAIARKYGVSRQRVSQIIGYVPKSVGNKEQRVIYVTPGLWEKAMEIAAAHKLFLKSGDTAGQGSVGQLIDHIAEGKLIVSRPEERINST